MLGGWIVFVVIWFAAATPGFFRRCVGPATPGAVGAIRALAAGVLLANVLWEDLPSAASLPSSMRIPMGVLEVLYALPIGFEQLNTSHSALSIFSTVTALLLFLAMIGQWTRVTVPLAAACYLVFGGIIRQYTHLFHQSLTALYVLAVLSLAPCGDGFSLDRLRRIWRTKPVPPSEEATAKYGWARYACWVAIAFPYLAAGLSKLRTTGLSWCEGENLRTIIRIDNLNPMQFSWGIGLALASAAPDFVFALLAWVALAAEVTFVLGLFVRVARYAMPAVMILLHTGIFLLQNVLFFDLFFMPLIFYDWRDVRIRVQRRSAARIGRLTVLYDGHCPLCRRTVTLLGGFDLLRQLEYLDFRSPAYAAFAAVNKLTLTQKQLDEEMYVLDHSGRTSCGFEGYRLIAWRLPAFWPIVPLLYLPGMHASGSTVYRAVARRRLKLLKCDDTCAVGPLQPAADTPRPADRSSLYNALLSCATAAILFGAWFRTSEYYPLTSMQMYAGPPSAGVVTYYKLSVRDEAGADITIKPDALIGALSDSRYRNAMAHAFDRGGEAAWSDFARALAATHDRVAPVGHRLAAVEVQKWLWDTRSDSNNPQHGRVVDRRVVRLIDRAG